MGKKRTSYAENICHVCIILLNYVIIVSVLMTRLADYRLKKKSCINVLITQENMLELQKLSQHCIKNCMYAIRFGLHNKQGIHGACPMEMLHALLLGLFRYTCDCFFEQIGESLQMWI